MKQTNEVIFKLHMKSEDGVTKTAEAELTMIDNGEPIGIAKTIVSPQENINKLIVYMMDGILGEINRELSNGNEEEEKKDKQETPTTVH